jgi:GAF domain-containing protein
MTHRETIAQFKTLLKEQGMRPALRFINSQSAHRFTGVYRFDGPTLRNVCLVDKEDESAPLQEDVPVESAYCLYVRDTGALFRLDDSLTDPRVEGHPLQQMVRAYCGIPLMTYSGQILGSLCHFDFTPRSISDPEVYILESIAPYITSWLEEKIKETK